MYENGKRVNGYQKKRKHKNYLKKKYAKSYFYGNEAHDWNTMVIALKDVERNKHGRHPLDYWRAFYLSGCRKYAKNTTNRILRQHGREICYDAQYYNDLEDVENLPRNGKYRKHFDYGWTVW